MGQSHGFQGYSLKKQIIYFMNSNQIRKTFLEFFKSKGHVIVPSAPMVIKNDPTLMFTNAGMNQFKDLFLGNAPVKYPRIADTQKCLRVSGKHNDLEEVGVDTYHHTMFEMLGNWSFGDYFKKDAIAWAWELLVDVYKVPTDRIYVTVFEGSKDDNLEYDQEAFDNWKQFIAEDKILNGSKKDNFWEMGDTGPCGPCSEIHVDLRDDEERKKIDGKTLVNNDHPQVIEIWNNVFMEFNRKADGSLEKLPAQHVDTGMGFERLCMVLQGKKSNYDTDVFSHIIEKIESISGLRYKPKNAHHKQADIVNIAMRVIADHVRAISFSIADGQLPSNSGAGYVIRRILRRAIRYGYQSLGLKEPFIFRLVPVLAHQLGEAFPELNAQKLLIEKVIKEEETSFFRTLEQGLKRIDNVCINLINSKSDKKVIEGSVVFELYDTYGFPVDLTSLIARGYGLSIDEEGFQRELEIQKNRSRGAAVVNTEDWVKVNENGETEFIGYKTLSSHTQILRYRKVKAKGKEQYQVVLKETPFYAESGGQVGDTGILENANEKIIITDTKKENGIIIHFTDKLPENVAGTFHALVDEKKRILTQNNHSATHLLHAALRNILGTHVEQKGSLVNEEHLRFDFSHFGKITPEEIALIEKTVNEKIRENIPLNVKLISIDEAKQEGAIALFGEKYGETVRVVTFDKNYSIELCGGTHVPATGQIGLFKITSESAVAAGIRRIEAVTADKAEQFINSQLSELTELKHLLKSPKEVVKTLQSLIDHNSEITKQLASLLREKAKGIKTDLISKVQEINGVNFIAEQVDLDSADAIKDLAFEMKNQIENLFMVVGAEVNGKANLTVMIAENLVKDKGYNASNIVRDLAKEIQGGGGGQAFFATAGGTNTQGIVKALNKAKTLIQS